MIRAVSAENLEKIFILFFINLFAAFGSFLFVLKQRLPKTRFSRRQPSILYTNVRSLFNKMDEIILNLNKYTPDVAVFCETWLDDSIPDVAISCNNYNVIRKDRNKYGGGIACYVNESFSPSVLTHFDIPSLNDCGSEFLPIILPKLLLIAIYHPFWNCPKEHEAAISCLLDIIDFSLSSSLDSSDLRIVIIGDLNDLRHYTNDIEQLTGTKAIVDFPTRCNNVLDQLFTNIDNFVPPQRLSPVGKSDHALIMWTSKTKSSVCEKRTFRNITNYNKAKFCESIHQYDWLSLVSSVTSIDDAASLFQSCLLALFDLCFPKRTIRIRWSDPPWVKPSFKRLIDDRDRAYKKRKLTKYYRLREEVIRHGRHLKSVYIRTAISTRNSKAIWNAVKSVGGLTKNNVKTGFSAQEFADYFSSIYTKHPPVTATPIRDSDLMNPPVEVTISEVSSILRRLRKKSPGPDGIPYWIYRDFSHLLSQSIVYIFNQSLNNGHVPMCFKESYITPIPKCAHPKEVQHYRPISNLSILSKCLEKIVVNKWIMPMLRERIGSNQFAYVPCRGTTVAMTLLYNRVLQFLDKCSGAVRLLTVDFAKAFDMLPHKTILEACKTFNLPSHVISWMGDFLSDRMQRVKVSSSVSSPYSAPSGVPQGSIIGPLMFCMAVDGFTALHHNSSIIMYADDLTLIHGIRSAEEDRLQSEFDNIISWSGVLGLPINYSKCAVIDIVTRRNLTVYPILLNNGTPIQTVQSLKILGIHLANDLKWNTHINKVVSQASQRLFILANLKRSDCPADVLRKAYFAFIRSIILYCCPVFINSPKYLTDKLIRIEKRASKIIGEEISPDVLSMMNRCCTSLFQKIVSDTEHPLREIFSVKERNNRNVCPFRPPLAKTVRFKKSFIKFCK